MMQADRDAEISRLADTADELIEEIQKLRSNDGRQLVKLTQYARMSRVIMYVVIFFTVTGITLTSLFLSNLIRINALADRLDVEQTVTRQQALCPLYQIFLNSRSEEGRKRAVDPEAYDRAFVVIESGYNALRCEEFIKDPKGR